MYLKIRGMALEVYSWINCCSYCINSNENIIIIAFEVLYWCGYVSFDTHYGYLMSSFPEIFELDYYVHFSSFMNVRLPPVF
jgi:hypothetical protein